MVRKIKIIRCGGTFDQVPQCSGELSIPPSTNELYRLIDDNTIREHLRDVCEIEEELFLYIGDFESVYDETLREYYNLFDSSNIHPEHWLHISKLINKCLDDGCDGVVILHGTDTLAFTSSILSYIFKDIHIPIIVTGSQKPLLNKKGEIDKKSDAFKNFVDACVAASEDLAGVYVVFNGKIMTGCRVTKIRSKTFDAFISINYKVSTEDEEIKIEANEEPVGRIEGKTIKLNIQRRRRKQPDIQEYKIKINPKVFLLKIFPGIDTQIFDKLDALGYEGLVIEGYGTGNIPTAPKIERNGCNIYSGVPFEPEEKWDVSSRIKEWVNKQKPVLITTQCLYEGVHPGVYEVGSIFREIGVIPAFDMTKEAALTKMMWVLGQVRGAEDRKDEYLKQVEKLILKNIAGELTPSLVEYYYKRRGEDER